MSKYQTPKRIQQSLKPDTTVFAELLSGKKYFSFYLQILKKISVLLTVKFVRTSGKYRGEINVLIVCNEVFSVLRMSVDGRSRQIVVENCSLQQISCYSPT